MMFMLRLAFSSTLLVTGFLLLEWAGRKPDWYWGYKVILGIHNVVVGSLCLISTFFY